MNAPIPIRLVGKEAVKLAAAASLHSRCLTDTVSSARGESLLQWSYRYLARRGHPIYVMMQQDQVIGGLVLLDTKKPYSPIQLLLCQPTSWLRAVRKLGLKSLLNQLWDLLQVKRRARKLINCDYITAVYVDETERRRGRAHQLLTRVIADSQSRGVGVAVDTNLSNHPARQLYASLGFVERGRTKRSVIFVLNAD
jgi:GNAT superfamily N-acetyltransferase